MDNPYASPTQDLQPVYSQGGLSPGVLRALAGTKPWVRFCSVIGFITTGLLILAAVAILVAGGFGGMEGYVMGISFVYGLMGVLYLFPSVKLWQYGSNIYRLMGSQSMADLEAALEAQRSFWRFVGIMVLILIALYVVLIALAGSIAAMR